MKTSDITGLVLAGGQGSRMGGKDKGLIVYQERPLVRHVLDRLHPQVASIIINANRNIDTYAEFGYPVVADAPNPQNESYAGPLAGLLAGLRASTTDWVLTVPCDSPHFPDDLVRQFIAASEKNGCGDIFVASTPVQSHPVFMLVHKEVTHTLAAFIASGGRKLGGWQQQNGASSVEFTDEAAFANLNTPEELAQLSGEK
ncbi:MAG TPA: molybdenum cofactor guanylyltransferase MobA [Rhodocyclaceae bacterium]|jgi:molybdopterin-guanine dinucleotide biosynthesis protein A|nr:molybdenum cofactor guanylyltransferase MobA [Rhodocyclaceae bacterium]